MCQATAHMIHSAPWSPPNDLQVLDSTDVPHLEECKKKYPAAFINVLEETCLGAIYSTPSSTLKSMLRICPLVQPKPSPDYNWVASFPPKSYEE